MNPTTDGRIVKVQIFMIVEAITASGATMTRCAVHSPAGVLVEFVHVDEHEAVTTAMQFFAGYLAGRMKWPSEDAVRMLLVASGRPRA